MKLIELCQYTLKQSLCDTGDLYAEYTAEEIIEKVSNEK